MRAEDIVSVVVGTAGHIDHGKSSLVRALTGIDPDRLKEEQERGMTIDLGFARLRLADGRTLGIIDVPGHERFVKNMVAGATGIDLVLFVVAADDGVMPQTREHLEILGLLGLARGLVAITKVDLPGVDATMLEALQDELRQLLRGTFLERAPLLPVSSTTGAGLPALRAALEAAVAACPPRPAAGPFRMPVQRVFSARGFGTVLTGVPLSGALGPGDEVELLTQGGEVLPARVRGLQAYGQSVERVRAGHSSALNLPELEREAATRGDVVASPGLFRPERLWEARITHLPGRRRALRARETVRLHVGTAELVGELVLLDQRELAPGASGWAQLRLQAGLAAAPGDRFVLRLHSPMETLGGGVLLGASRHRLKAGKPRVLEQLARREAALHSPERALAQALDGALEQGEPAGIEALAPALGLPRALLLDLLAREEARGEVVRLPGRGHEPVFLTRTAHQRREAEVAAAEGRVLAALEEWTRAHALRAACPLAELRGLTGLGGPVLQTALERLAAPPARVRAWQPPETARRLLEPGWVPASHVPVFSGDEERFARGLRALYRGVLQRPPGVEDALREGRVPWLPPERQREVLLALLERGELCLLEEEVVLGAEELAAATRAACEALRRHGPLPTGALREALGASRKVAVAVLEHLDLTGVTRRQGDVRALRAPAGRGPGGKGE